MKKSAKIIAAIAATAIAGSAAIGGTMAWLTANKTVTNSFTVGNITLTLDETYVNTSGAIVEDSRVESQSNAYKVYPGATIGKDPKIDVTGEDCWLYVYVKNDTTNAGVSGDAITYEMADSWVEVSGMEGLYRYTNDKVTNDLTDVSVFKNDQVKVSENVNGEITGDIVVNAYAHQAEGVLMNDADAAAKTFFN